MPLPTPTDEDIDDVREVAGENSNDFVSSLIDNLNDAQWDKALSLVTSWLEFPAGSVLALEGGRDGVKDSDELAREDIRKRMRLLLGLPELRSVGLTGMGASQAIGTRWIY